MLDELHTRIRRAREQAGFSQEKMAEELGVGRTTYVNFETGRSRLFSSLLDRMADRLGKSVEEILFGERPDEQLLRDEAALEEWRSSLVADYESRLSALQEKVDALARVIDVQDTTIRTLNDAKQFLMSQLRKED